MKLEYHLDRANTFCPMYWTWNGSLRDSEKPEFSPKRESSVCVVWDDFHGTRDSTYTDHNWWRSMGLPIRNKATIIGMAFEKWNKTEENSPFAIKGQGHAHGFLRSLRCCAPGIPSNWSKSQWTTCLSWGVCVKQSVKDGRNCGKTTRGFCIMTTHHRMPRHLCANFWQKTQWMSLRKHRINQTWPPATFSCSACWKNHFADNVESIEDIKEKPLRELKVIPSAAYKRCFQDWLKRWHMCVASNGDYFEGDGKNFDDWILILIFKNKIRILFDHNSMYTAG